MTEKDIKSVNNNIIKILKKSNKLPEKLSEILKYLFVDIVGIDQTKYFIYGSYPMKDMEMKDVTNLNINLDSNEFLKLNNLCTNGYGFIEFYNNCIRWKYDISNLYNNINKEPLDNIYLEAYMMKYDEGYPDKSFSLRNLSKKHLIQDKYDNLHINMKYLIKWKTMMNRKKDLLDLTIIKKSIKQSKKDG